MWGGEGSGRGKHDGAWNGLNGKRFSLFTESRVSSTGTEKYPLGHLLLKHFPCGDIHVSEVLGRWGAVQFFDENAQLHVTQCFPVYSLTSIIP